MSSQRIHLITHSLSSIPNPWVSILLGIVLILTIYHFWFQSLRHVKMVKNIPGPKPVPILGNALHVIGLGPEDVMKKILGMVKEYDTDVGRAYFGPRLIIGLLNPVDIELILGSPVHLEKPWEYSLFESWIGQGLLTSYGDKWRSHRKMLAPTFHSSILKTFMPIFNKNAIALLKKLDKAKSLTFDVHDYMSGTTVDILLETAMGVNTNDDTAGFKYAKAIMDMCSIIHQRHYNLLLRLSFFFRWTKMAKDQIKLLDIIRSLTKRVLKTKKEDYALRVKKGEPSLYNEAVAEISKNSNGVENERTENYQYIRDDLEINEENDVGEKKRLAFLDFMIEASNSEGNKLNDNDIEDEVSTITFAGHDTTAAASSFVLTVLGTHQDIQEKCITELKEIFHDNWNRPITFNDTLQMKYLERVIMETMRLYPPVPMIARKINEDVKLASRDVTIPAGTTVIISQYVTHRLSKIWANPDKFDPDNFLPENCQGRHYYAYFPFSAGPRSCLGRKYAMLKLKVLIASVLRNYKLISPNEEKDFRLQSDIILKRADGFQLRLEDRIL
ncbi:cytochrome P450 4g1-like [Euwallacea fornicatus]|uniref:cytochrome P450 4g1-like n=1 Tax=Euwallacea fornicatus TaxID=995702 RepID=UPI00338DFD2F